jgi:hypothetical protein
MDQEEVIKWIDAWSAGARECKEAYEIKAKYSADHSILWSERAMAEHGRDCALSQLKAAILEGKLSELPDVEKRRRSLNRHLGPLGRLTRWFNENIKGGDG